MVPKPKTSARRPSLHREEDPLPNSAAGQARQFYYGTDENELTVESKDFDHAYDMTGQSQALRDLRQSKNEESLGASGGDTNKSGRRENAFSFGGHKDEKDVPMVGPDQQLIEDSTNSAMCNMAISLDPLSAEKALGGVDRKALQKQKEAMQPYMKSLAKPKKDNRDEKHADTPADKREQTPTEHDGYSQDAFDSEEVEVQVEKSQSMSKLPAEEQSVSKYAISMGQPMEGEDEIALQGLLAHRYNQEPRESQELKSTSKFQEVQDSFDREFGSGDPDFDEAERQANLMAAGEEPKTSPKVSPNKNNLD